MSKTYEAMSKKIQSSADDSMQVSSLSDWNLVDLKNTRQKGDLEKKITFYSQKHDAKVFNFTSSRSREGVSTIVFNLAKYMATKKTKKRILLIDTNLQAPVQHIAFNCSKGPGIYEVLAGTTSLPEVIQDAQTGNIHLITCGNPQPGSISDIEQEQFLETIKKLKEQYDCILIDSAPLLISADSLSTALCSDITFLIIQSLKVQKEVAERAKLMLQDNECPIGGVILNRIQQVIPGWMYKII